MCGKPSTRISLTLTDDPPFFVYYHCFYIPLQVKSCSSLATVCALWNMLTEVLHPQERKYILHSRSATHKLIYCIAGKLGGH